MLELLLVQYEEMFGEPFPLKKVAGRREIDVINILLDCVRTRSPYDPVKRVPDIVTGAPSSI
jgi:hypothetical protein